MPCHPMPCHPMPSHPGTVPNRRRQINPSNPSKPKRPSKPSCIVHRASCMKAARGDREKGEGNGSNGTKRRKRKRRRTVSEGIDQTQVAGNQRRTDKQTNKKRETKTAAELLYSDWCPGGKSVNKWNQRTHTFGLYNKAIINVE